MTSEAPTSNPESPMHFSTCSGADQHRTDAKPVDPESYGLAVHFLPFGATDALKQSLAEAIQGAVEDWFVGRCESGEEHDFAWTYDIEGSGERHDYEACSKCHEKR